MGVNAPIKAAEDIIRLEVGVICNPLVTVQLC